MVKPLLSDDDEKAIIEGLKRGRPQDARRPDFVIGEKADPAALEALAILTQAIREVGDEIAGKLGAIEIPGVPDNSEQIEAITKAINSVKIPAAPDMSGALTLLARSINDQNKRHEQAPADYSELVIKLIASIDKQTQAIEANTKALRAPKTVSLSENGRSGTIKPEMRQ